MASRFGGTDRRHRRGLPVTARASLTLLLVCLLASLGLPGGPAAERVAARSPSTPAPSLAPVPSTSAPAGRNVAGSGRAAANPTSGTGTRDRPARTSPSGSPSPSPAPTVTPALAPITDTISLFGFVCPAPGPAGRVVYTRNPALPEPTGMCRTAGAGQLTVVVADPADLTAAYDRVQTGPNGYANAVVPVGQPFVLVLTNAGAPVRREDVSPVYRLNANPALRQPMAVRLFRVGPVPATTGSPLAGAAAASEPAGTPEAGPTAPVTILGLVCASAGRAGIYDYLGGLIDPAGPPPGSGPCRRATVDELEFLLLDNDNPSTLYDDVTTGLDGIATARAPVDRPFFVTEFADDPGADTGLPGGSAAIMVPADPAARQPIALTVVRNVAPGALDLPAGTVLVSTVVCPPAAGPASLTVLGPAPTVLIRSPGSPTGTPQPGASPVCEEATGSYEIAPYGDEAVPPIAVTDGAGDGALIVPLPATLTSDGGRAFNAYRITETGSGLTTSFDVQEGAWTSLRVVLTEPPATPVPADAPAASLDAGTASAGSDDARASAGSGTPVPASATTTEGPAATAVPAPEENDAGGLPFSPVRLLWGALAVLAIAIFLAGTWVLRRPGHRWHRWHRRAG